MGVRQHLKGMYTKSQEWSRVCCLNRQSLSQETEGSCLWVFIVCLLAPPQSPPLLISATAPHTFVYKAQPLSAAC